jgi:methylmalonyl-CoA/ethylmalonyl-CoA epimerase
MVVQDAEKAASRFAELFGFEILETRDDAEGGFRSTLMSKADVKLELIEPTAPQGPIRSFIEKRGGGLHHVSIQVGDLDEEMARLRSRGAQFVGEEPLRIDDATRLVFIHPRSAEGLLIELVERKKAT